MRMGNYSIVIIAEALFFQGCLAPRAVTPHVEGKVIDKNTHDPIANASVYFKEFPEKVTITNTLGEFLLEEHIGIGLMLPIGDPVPPEGTLIVKKPGCLDYSIRTFGMWGDIMLDIELDCKESTEK